MARWPGLIFTLTLAVCSALWPAPSFARRGGFGGGFGHFDGHPGRFYGGYRRYGYPGYGYGDAGYAPACIWARAVVPTPWGLQWRLVPACY